MHIRVSFVKRYSSLFFSNIIGANAVLYAAINTFEAPGGVVSSCSRPQIFVLFLTYLSRVGDGLGRRTNV